MFWGLVRSFSVALSVWLVSQYGNFLGTMATCSFQASVTTNVSKQKVIQLIRASSSNLLTRSASLKKSWTDKFQHTLVAGSVSSFILAFARKNSEIFAPGHQKKNAKVKILFKSPNANQT